jgi:capsular polysaccharide export protein
MPGVRLISPAVNSHVLTLGAAAVLTISGTAGWEAMLYEKPVITLGRAFYNMSGLTHEVHSLWSLPEIIHNAIFRWKPDPERLLMFVAAVLAGTYEGEMVYPHYRFRDEAGNAQKIAAALRAEFGALDRIDSMSQTI